VQARWNLERGMSNGGPDGFEELLEAAYAEPKLRQLYPLSSHWTLHFSRSTGYATYRSSTPSAEADTESASQPARPSARPTSPTRPSPWS
jgi:hypothetical protein